MTREKDSSYSKLKKENIELKRKLDILANEPQSKEGVVIAQAYKLLRELERRIMAGEPLYQP